MTSPSNSYWLYGKHAVLCALKNKERQIKEILVTDSTYKANKREIDLHKFRIVSPNQIDIMIKSNTSIHQGIAAHVTPLEIKSLSYLIKKLDGKTKSLIVALDQITDSQNAGAIIRSCSAFSVDGIITTKHNSFPENGALAKASSGTIENVDLITVANLSNTFEELKEKGYWIVGLDGEGKEDISKIKEYDKLVLVLGAEGSGIRRLTKENCDFLAKIKISENTESLNVSVATAIALYEFNR